MSETTTKVNKIDSEVGSVKNRFNEYSESVNCYNDICGNILGKSTDFDDRFSERLSLMDEKLLDIEWRSMRENL